MLVALSLNLLNLALYLLTNSAKYISRIEIQMNDQRNLQILLLLTGVSLLEIAVVQYVSIDNANFLLIKVVPFLFEYAFVFRIFNRYMLFYANRKLRHLLTYLFVSLVALRSVFSYFYFNINLFYLLAIPAVELSISALYIHACYIIYRHYSSLEEHQVHEWLDEHYSEEVWIFQIMSFHRKLNICFSNFLHIFILNGTFWVIVSWKYGHEVNDDVELVKSFESFSILGKAVPHALILSNYLFLYCRDKNHMRREKQYEFELRVVLCPE